MSFGKLVKQIEELSHSPHNSTSDIYDSWLHASEEFGEIAKALRVRLGRKKTQLDEEVEYEIADAIINLVELYFFLGGERKHLKHYLETKINKWQKKVDTKSRTGLKGLKD